MSEILAVSESLPFIATAVGAAVGVGFEAHVLHYRQQKQEALAAAHRDVSDNLQKPGRIERLLRPTTIALAGVCALAGFSNSQVWESESAIHEIPPALEIVVDHSGGTTIGNHPAAPEINQLVSQFDDEDSIRATAHIASVEGVIKKKPSQVAKNVGFGDAALDQATQSALDDARLGSGRTESVNKKSSAVLVITNGNEVGVPGDIVAKANSNDIPVFVVNVESGSSEEQTTKDLQAIATGTKAKYWDAKSKNIDKVSKDVTKVLVPQNVHDKSPDSPWPNRVLAATLSVLAIGSVYVGRRTGFIGRELKVK